MSVNINFRPTSNETRWKSIKCGDFAMIEGVPNHPIPSGLYRVFTISSGVEIVPDMKQYSFLLVPMFDGPFPEGMFPYMLTETPYPNIQQLVSRVHIDVEVNQ